MSLRSVLVGLTEIEKSASTKEKKELIKPFLEDKLAAFVTKAALNQNLHYNVGVLPPYQKEGGTDVDKIFRKLLELSKQGGASDRDKLDLAFHASIDMATWEVVQRIVKKDLRCGASAKTFNSVVPKFVRTIPYCRCSSEKKMAEINFPAAAQEKADGIFINALINKKKKTAFITRNGKKVRQLKHLAKALKATSFSNAAFMGELLVIKDGVVLDRKTGNGIINSCIQGTADPKDAACVVFRVWDHVTLDEFWEGKSPLHYMKRFKVAEALEIEIDSTLVETVITERVENLKEAKDFYKRMRKLGKEGAILKDFRALWKDHTSPMQIKMKNIMDVELIIADWYYGDKGKKYERCLGGLTVETRCGLLRSNVGSGFSDSQRGYFPVEATHKFAILRNEVPEGEEHTDIEAVNYINSDLAEAAIEYWESMKGELAQLECESVIKSKTDKIHSLFLPRFIEARVDKSEADSLKELLEK